MGFEVGPAGDFRNSEDIGGGVFFFIVGVGVFLGLEYLALRLKGFRNIAQKDEA